MKAGRRIETQFLHILISTDTVHEVVELHPGGVAALEPDVDLIMGVSV